MNPEIRLNNLIRTGELRMTVLNREDFESEDEQVIIDYLNFKFKGTDKNEPLDSWRWWGLHDAARFWEDGFLSYNKEPKFFTFWRTHEGEEKAFLKDHLLRALYQRFKENRYG